MISKCLLFLVAVLCWQGIATNGERLFHDDYDLIVPPKSISNFAPCVKQVAHLMGHEVVAQWPAAKRCPGAMAKSLVTEPYKDLMAKLVPLRHALSDLVISIVRNCVTYNPIRVVVCISEHLYEAQQTFSEVLPPAQKALGWLLLGVTAVGPSILACEAQVAGQAAIVALQALATFPSCMRGS